MAHAFWLKNLPCSAIICFLLSWKMFSFLGSLHWQRKLMFFLPVYHLKAILCYLFGYLMVLFYLSGIIIWVCRLRVRMDCNCWWFLVAENGIFIEALSCKILRGGGALPTPEPPGASTHGFHSFDFTPPSASVFHVRDHRLFWLHSEKQLICLY